MPDFKEILYEKKRGGALITLNRPDAMNAISRSMIKEMQKRSTTSKKTTMFAPSCSPAPGGRFPPAWTRATAPAGAGICTGPTASSPDKPPPK